MDQLIPGVQQGQRLTLSGVSDRIGRVEEIVAKLAEDFYGTPDTPITQAEVEKVAIQPSSFVDGGCVVTCLGDCQRPWIDQSDRIDALEQENAGLKAQVEHLREQRDQVNPILELKDARISELEGIELILREKLTQKQDQLDEALRDAEFWNREAGNADDHAASIQNELDNLRVKLAGLL